MLKTFTLSILGVITQRNFLTLFSSKKFFGCQVIAIDPLSELEPLWKSARPKATFIPTAIGTHEDTMRLKIPNVDNMFSTLEGGTLKLGGEDFHERLVKVQRLSTIIDSFGIKNILFISIDVEGFELDVLKSINFDVVDIKCFLVENNSHDPMGEGSFKGLNIVWLRWATLEGELLPTQQEKIQREYERREIAEALVIQERQEKEIAQALVIQERAEKEQERQKNEKLAAYLRSLGINPDEI